MNYTTEEKRVIKLFAAMDKPTTRMRADTIAAHQAMMRRMLKSNVTRETLPYGDPHFEFMREIDNPCPCPILKRRWREELLKPETVTQQCTACRFPDECCLRDFPECQKDSIWNCDGKGNLTLK